jgi:hypothetical protein
MPSIDPFNATGFNLTTLTQAINKLPNQYGRLEQLGLFPIKGISTRTLEVEERNGVLALVPTHGWGAPGAQNKSGKRILRTFSIPQMTLEDAVQAADVVGIRRFGSENELETVEQRVNDKLQEMRNKLDQTLEYRRFGALKGIMYDADASTVLYNLYTEFSVSPMAIDFALNVTTTEVLTKCLTVKRHIEDKLMGERCSGYLALVSSEFYDKLTTHAVVKDAYKYWSAAQRNLTEDQRSGFTFGGITFEEYRATVTNTGGTQTKLITALDGHIIPLGTSSTFSTFAAAADFVETVNTIGQQYYVKSEVQKYVRGLDMHVQSNVLPMCMRPELLVRIYTS